MKNSRGLIGFLIVSQFNFAIAQTLPNALPTGGKVVAGNATISQTQTANSATMNINQTSQRAVVNWDSFNVGKNAQVNFNQPNASAVTLNRVTGATQSMIDGAVNANGQVVFVNPNGVTFGKGAEINAGGVVATTMDIANKDFMDGKSTYKGNGKGVVVNEGKISTNDPNGYIALLAPEVRNEGYLLAKMGPDNTVAMASGKQVTLDFRGDQLMSVTIDRSVYQGLVDNKRVVEAPGGLIIVAAGAANRLMGSVVKNTGRITASSMVNNGGVIELVANTVTQAGTVSANGNGAGTVGGQVNISGKNIILASGSKTTATGNAGGGSIEIGLGATAATNLHQAKTSVVDSRDLSAPAKERAQVAKVQSTQTTSVAQSVAPVKTVATATPAVTTASTPSMTSTLDQLQANAVAKAQVSSTSGQMAKTVTVQSNAIVNASATKSGNGGSILIWSETKTAVNGVLLAMGGALGGNGGFIETSSKGSVALGKQLVVNTTAAKGNSGLWFLDPIDLIIDAGAANVISTALSSNNVSIAVNGNVCPSLGSCTQAGSGSLTIASGANILKQGNTQTTLTLSSSGIFNLNADISGQNLNVIINSSIAYLNVGTTINATQVTVQAQSVYANGTINASNAINASTSLGAAIQLLAQAIYVSGSLNINTSSANNTGNSSNTNTNTVSYNGNVIRKEDLPAFLTAQNTTTTALDVVYSSTAANDASANSANTQSNVIHLTAVKEIKLYSTAEIKANGTTGGYITFSAEQINAQNGSLIQANGNNGPGGIIGFTGTQIALAGTIAANGSNGGSFTLSASTLNMDNAALIQTNGSAGPGGTITIQADQDIQVNSTQITANGSTDGGSIRIMSRAGSLSLFDSLIQTNGSNGRGGSIGISAFNQTILTSTAVEASGFIQGGTILIGNDANNSSLPFSIYTSLDALSTINASQTNLSNTTAGGFIETSGHTLNLLASINAGRGGMWLLDPTDLYVGAAPNGATDYVNNQIISSALASGNVSLITNVSANTCSGSGVSCTSTAPSGNLYISAPITNNSSAGTSTLTLSAVNIYINAAITASTGVFNLSLTSTGETQINQAVTITGALTVNSTGQLTTAFGNNITANTAINFTGSGLTSLGGNLTTTSGGISIAGDLQIRTDVSLITDSSSAVSLSGNVASVSTLTTTFNASGTFNTASLANYVSSTPVEVLVVGGGAAGGTGQDRDGGGGGAGGLIYNSNYVLSNNSFNVTVGAGGQALTHSKVNGVWTAPTLANGNNSTFDALTASGGGTAAGVAVHAVSGGSGGGGYHGGNSLVGADGIYEQGNKGGNASLTNIFAAGGGGGAGGVGQNSSGTAGGNGGAGLSYAITGSLAAYAGGGGGGTQDGGTASSGGAGGGGQGGANSIAIHATAGVANTGGGGGGGSYGASVGGAGGSGVVIVRYISTGGSSLTIQSGNSTVQGAISGSGGLTFSGRTPSSVLTLNSFPTFTGSQVVTQGSISGSTPTAVYIDIVSEQSSSYGTAAGLNYWYSTSPTLYGVGYLVNSLPQTVQTLAAGATSVAITTNGMTGSLALSSATPDFSGLTNVAGSAAYYLTLTPSLIRAGFTFSAGDSKNFTINKANLSVTGSQVYNGSTTFNASNLAVTGVNGETLTISGTGTLGSSGNVQTNQPLSSVSGLTVAGTTIANYNALTAAQTSVSVTPAPLAIYVSGTYNGTLSYTSSNATIAVAGLVGSDTGGSVTSVTVNDSTVANANKVTAINAVTGFTASNYAINTSTNNTLSGITPVVGATNSLSTNLVALSAANLSVTGSQVYNGSTTFNASNLAVTGVNGETLTISGTGTLGSSGNVQTNQPLSSVSGLTVAGTTIANYNALTAAQTSVSVTPAPLAIYVSGTYNGTLSYTSSNATIAVAGLVGSDTGGSVTSVTVNDSTVANANKVTAINAVTGFTASNYAINTSTNNTLSGITPVVGATNSLSTNLVALYSINIAVSSGNVNLRTLSSTTNLTLSGTATLDLAGNSLTLASITGSYQTSITNSIVSSGVTLTLIGAAPGSYSGVIRDGGASKTIGLSLNSGSDSGIFTLSGTNLYTGNTTISRGTIAISNTSALGSSVVTVSSGAALALSNGITIANAIGISGSGISSAGAISNTSGANTINGLITLNGAATIGSAAGTLTFGHATTAISGTAYDLTFVGNGNTTISTAISNTSGALTMAGGGLLTLSVSNDYSGGTTISSGTLKVGIDSSGSITTSPLGTGNVSVNTGGALDLNGHSIANNLSLAGTGVSTSGALYSSIASASTASGAITLTADTLIKSTSGLTLGDIDGSYSLTVSNGSGAITLGAIGANTPLTTLTLQGTGANTLNGDIQTSGAVDLKGTSRTTNFAHDRIITTTNSSGNGNIILGTTNTAFGLTLNAGSGTIALGATGTSADGMSAVALSSLMLAGSGANTLSAGVSVYGALDLGSNRTNTITNSLRISATTGPLSINSISLINGVTLTLGDNGTANITSGNVVGPNTGSANVTFSTGGTVTVNGSIGTNINTVWLNKTTGNVSITGSFASSILRMDSGAAYNLSMTGAVNSIGAFYNAVSTNATTAFETTGTLTLGTSSSATFSFGSSTGAFTVSQPSALTLAGTISTSATTAGTGSITLGSSSEAITLAAGTTLNTTASNGNITLNGAVTGAGKTLSLNAGTGSISTTAAISGVTDLSLIANTMSWTAAVGGTGALTINPGTNSRVINLGGTGSGTLDISAAMLNLLGTSFTSLTVGGASQSGAIYLKAAYSTPDSLVLRSSGGIDIAGDLSATGTATLTLTGPVTISGAARSITTNNTALSFSSTVNSSTSTARALTISTGSGDITFSGIVGGVNPLAALSLTSTGSTSFNAAVTAGSLVQNASSGTTAINGGAITTSGLQTFGNNVTLGTNTTLDATSGSSNNAITFSGTLNSFSSTPYNLTTSSG
ncbi:filamentous hemagglutinin N-terminal domain-containing protein, partial [Polynucleobacter paneuropaeus]|nr:filamentous hemagglutinin N-terminal domain-containing protein [Polynucleobacter paneuropaeus]